MCIINDIHFVETQPFFLCLQRQGQTYTSLLTFYLNVFLFTNVTCRLLAY